MAAWNVAKQLLIYAFAIAVGVVAGAYLSVKVPLPADGALLALASLAVGFLNIFLPASWSQFDSVIDKATALPAVKRDQVVKYAEQRRSAVLRAALTAIVSAAVALAASAFLLSGTRGQAPPLWTTRNTVSLGFAALGVLAVATIHGIRVVSQLSKFRSELVVLADDMKKREDALAELRDAWRADETRIGNPVGHGTPPSVSVTH